MKKVLLISLSNLPSLQYNLYNTYQSMKELGVDVYTIGADNITAKGIKFENKNQLITVPKNPMPTISSLKMINNSIDNIIRIIKNINPDCIHFISKHTWNYFLIKKIKKFENKIIHTFHDPIGHTGELRRYGVIFYNKIIGRNVDGIIVHSDKSKSETQKYIKPRCKVTKVPLGEMIWKEYEENKSFKKNVLIFGRINPYKGCDLIPKISKELSDRNSEIKITIAGKASNDVNDEIIKKINECSNVKFINEFIDEDEVYNYFKQCDIVLITHKSITQSGVILQAYRYSKPIIAFNIEGIHEFIEEEKTGLLSEAYLEDKYVDNILKLYSDLEELNEYSKNAWKFGAEKFSNKVMAKKLLDIYMIGVE